MATIQSPQQQSVILHDISWETYEWLLADHADRSAPRFTYDQGTLEIMSPIPEHERCTWAINRLVEAVAERMGVDFVNLGSTTFNHTSLSKLPILAQFGVAEVWRYDGERLEIWVLEVRGAVLEGRVNGTEGAWCL